MDLQKSIKASYVSTKNADFSSLLYHNLITIYTNTTKRLSLMHNLIPIFLQFTETGNPFRTKDVQLSVICAAYMHMSIIAGPVTVVNNQLTGYGR